MGREVIVHGNELYHHGIKGQKWGERRYQNEDGTLTEAGKRRYARRSTRELNGLEEEKSRLLDGSIRAENAANRKWFNNDKNRLVNKMRAGLMKDGARAVQEQIDSAIKKLDSEGFDVKSKSLTAEQRRARGWTYAILGDMVRAGLVVSGLSPMAAYMTPVEEMTAKSGITYHTVKSKPSEIKQLKQKSKGNRLDQASWDKDPKKYKAQKMKTAKEKDSWDLDFLELVQNKKELSNPKELMKLYDKYLDAPDYYWAHRGELGTEE